MDNVGIVVDDLAAVGEADWSIVSVHARTCEEHDNELREKRFTV